MIDDNDQDRLRAHGRLRKEFDDLDLAVKSLQRETEQNTTSLALLKQDVQGVREAPVQFDKIFLSPRVWLMMTGWLLTTVVAIVVSVLATTASLRADLSEQRSDVRDILTKMEAQKTADAARDKLRDVESATLRSDVAELKRLSNLQQLQLQQVQLSQVGEKKAGK